MAFSRPVAILVVSLVTLHCAHGFYIPGVAPTEYKQQSRLEIKVKALSAGASPSPVVLQSGRGIDLSVYKELSFQEVPKQHTVTGFGLSLVSCDFTGSQNDKRENSTTLRVLQPSLLPARG